MHRKQEDAFLCIYDIILYKVLNYLMGTQHGAYRINNLFPSFANIIGINDNVALTLYAQTCDMLQNDKKKKTSHCTNAKNVLMFI